MAWSQNHHPGGFQIRIKPNASFVVSVISVKNQLWNSDVHTTSRVRMGKINASAMLRFVSQFPCPE
jgi:hypothetical protein